MKHPLITQPIAQPDNRKHLGITFSKAQAFTKDPPPAYPFSSDYNVKQRAANRWKLPGDSAQAQPSSIDMSEGRFKRLSLNRKAAPRHIADPPKVCRTAAGSGGGF